MRPPPKPTANPGPAWGPAFLLWAARTWPRALFRPALMAGTWVALAFMPQQRRHSRAYLATLLGRRIAATDVWRHFFAFIESLLLNLKAGAGAPLTCRVAEKNGPAFEALLGSDQPALFGTFHVGASDLLGYLLGDRGRKVAILRLQVGNSHDTRLLHERFGDRVSFLWVNDPQSLIFELKAALDAGLTLAMKCDRLEFSAKAERFRFLGAERLFPFTIYHLSVLFGRPLVFCVALAEADGTRLLLIPSPVFTPDPSAGREVNLRAARVHFQAVLDELEALLRVHPHQWFNFLPLNPAA